MQLRFTALIVDLQINLNAVIFWFLYQYEITLLTSKIMLTKLTLRNYRGFRSHIVPFQDVSVLVGRNNAGKSTIIEALRLVSMVSNRAPYLNYFPPPEWLDMPVGFKGVSPSLRGIEFDFRNVNYQYGSPPAIIMAEFSSGESISIYLHNEEEDIFAVIKNNNNRPVISKAQANNLDSTPIQIMPPIGRLNQRESILAADYVQSCLNTNLSPLHFRNQILLFFEEHYEDFVHLAESTWPHLGITEFNRGGSDGTELSLLIRDGRFVAEVGWVGNGLQAWLQTVWFLARIPIFSTIILDEPDLFLHADLQRKLLRFLIRRYDQVIIATHSLEILSDVDPESVLIIDKDKRRSKFATSVPAIQSVIENMGGVHNLQLTRLWSARRCIFIEGDDIDFLSIFHSCVFPESETPLSSIPNITLGGAGNWKHAIGGTIGLRNAGDENIKTYCILDPDYKTDDEINEILEESKRHKLELHFWKCKEIENYVLIPEAIQRYVKSRSAGKKWPRIDTINNRMERICETLKDDVIDGFAAEEHARNRQAGIKAANRNARKKIAKLWKTLEGKLRVVPGKRVVSELSKWSKQSYGVSFGALSIARELAEEELDQEVIHVISSIEKAVEFPLK